MSKEQVIVDLLKELQYVGRMSISQYEVLVPWTAVQQEVNVYYPDMSLSEIKRILLKKGIYRSNA